MSFIISKISNANGIPHQLYYLVENYRKDNRIKRRTLLHLHQHRNLEELLKATQQEEGVLIQRLSHFESELEGFIKYGTVPQLLAFRSPIKIKNRLIIDIEETRAEIAECQKRITTIKNYIVKSNKSIDSKHKKL